MHSNLPGSSNRLAQAGRLFPETKLRFTLLLFQRYFATVPFEPTVNGLHNDDRHVHNESFTILFDKILSLNF